MHTKGLVSFDGNCAGYIRPLGDDQPAIARVYALADLHRFVACWNALANLNPDAVADVVAAAEALVQAQDALREFEAANPDNSTSAWERLLDAEGVAEEQLRTALTRIRGEG